jgi:hypothetical protein
MTSLEWNEQMTGGVLSPFSLVCISDYSSQTKKHGKQKLAADQVTTLLGPRFLGNSALLKGLVHSKIRCFQNRQVIVSFP